MSLSLLPGTSHEHKIPPWPLIHQPRLRVGELKRGFRGSVSTFPTLLLENQTFMVNEKDFKKKKKEKENQGRIEEYLRRKKNHWSVQVKNLKTRCELLNNLLSFLPS